MKTIRIRDKKISEKLEEFKKVENIKCNTKALEQLLLQSDELVSLQSKYLKLEHKKSL